MLRKYSLLISTLSFKMEDDTLPDGHDTLVLRFNTSFRISSKSLKLGLNVNFFYRFGNAEYTGVI